MLPWDLEDWLVDAADRVIAKHSTAPQSLTDAESLLHELWLFDTQTRNGGVSQYFCNFPDRWALLTDSANSRLPTFGAFAATVQSIISGAVDPFDAILASPVDLDSAYYASNADIIRELRAVVDAGG